jgi:hypothetical protein
MEYVVIFYFLLMYRWESAVIRKITKEGSNARTAIAVIATILTITPPVFSLYKKFTPVNCCIVIVDNTYDIIILYNK